MKTQMLFRGFEKTAALESFLESSINGLMGPFQQYDNGVFKVVLNEESHRNGNRKPVFSCELILKSYGRLAPIYIKKQSRDFYESVTMALDAMKALLSKQAHMERYQGNNKKWSYITET